MSRGGFFNHSETTAKVDLSSRETQCGKCKLFQHCRSPKMKPFGKGRRKILIIAEAPGEREDAVGKPLVGKAGRLVKATLRANGIKMDEHCYRTNAVVCRPPKNRTPSKNEIAACRPRLLREIKELRPSGIIVMGGAALDALIGHRWLGDPAGLGGITRWRGFQIPDRELGAWICPVFHPSYVQRNEKQPVIGKIFEDDMAAAVKRISSGPPPSVKDEREHVQILKRYRDIKLVIEKIYLQEDFVVLDWETTGLRPYREGQQIVSVSLTVPSLETYTWNFANKREEWLIPLKRMFVTPDLGKGAHNLNFEEVWAAQFVCPIRNWKWDSCLAAHMLDNRARVTPLKFQAYVNFGVIDYDSHMKKWKESPPAEKRMHGANGMNRMLKLMQTPKGRRQVLEYNGLDTVFEMKLALKQMEELGLEDLSQAR